MSYDLVQADTLPEALTLLGEHGGDAKVLAGGTAVILLLQQKLISPGVLVDIGRIAGLDYIRLEDDGLHLGPMVTLRDVEKSGLVREKYPALARACGEVGNVRIRNQATIGGNLAEADYASDPPAMLLALDAQVTVRKTARSRTIPLTDFLLSFYTTTLEPDELIADVLIPPLPASSQTTYLKFKTRSSEDRPCVGIAAVATLANGICTDLRVAVGAAAEMPVRLPNVEQLATGQVLGDDLIAEIADSYASQIDTLDDLRASAWYRKQMIRVHVRRALEEIRDGGR